MIKTFGLIFSISIFTYLYFELRTYTNKKRLNYSLFIISTVILIISLNPNLKILESLSILFYLNDLPGGKILTISVIISLINLLIIFLLITNNSAEKYTNVIKNLDFQGKLNLKSKDLIIIVPVFNEYQNLDFFLKKNKKYLKYILFIDDGSTDETLNFLIKKKQNYISLPSNLGGGFALRVGYAQAIKNKINFVATVDADNQHLISDVQYFKKFLKKNISIDVVIGSRLLKTRKIISIRVFGIYFFNFFFFLITGKRISDCSSGIKCFRANILRKLNLSQNQYHTPEFLLECIKKKIHIKYLPTTILKRKFGLSKKGNIFIYFYGFLNSTISSWFR